MLISTTKDAVKFFAQNGHKVYSDGKREDWLADGGTIMIFSPKQIISLTKKTTPKNKDTYFRVWRGDYFCGIYNSRELINYARAYQKDHSVVSHLVKKGKGKNRAAIRDAIKTENFDKIPKDKNLKEEDRWFFD